MDQSTTNPFNFADDKKIACTIKHIDDTNNLQLAINNFIDWCDKNELEVNLSKCKIITFSHKQQPIIRDYYIKDQQKIERVHEIRDLGVILNSKLDFKSHIEYTIKKTNSVLAFVRRTCRANFGTEVATLMYKLLVRSNVIFGCVIWSPHHLVKRNALESIQKQAVMFLNKDYLNRSDNNYKLAPYSERCAKFDLTSLVRDRVNAAAIFMHKIIMGKYSSNVLRNELDINWGVRCIRRPEFIRIKHCKTDYAIHSPFNTACRAFIMQLFSSTLQFHQIRSLTK